MSWKKESPQTPIPKEVIDVVQTISTVAGSLSALFGAVTTLLEIAKAFITDTLDPFSALVSSIITELETIINDLFATGFYMLVVNPLELTRSSELVRIAEERKRLNDEQDVATAQFKLEEKSVQVKFFDSSKSEGVAYEQQLVGIQSRKDLKSASLQNQRELLEQERADLGFDSFGIPILTPKAAIDYAIESFDDLGDTARPIFSDNAEVSAIGFLATAPGLDQFKKIIEDFLKVFNVPDFNLMLFRINEISNQSVVQSSLPDWKSVRLNSFSPMDELQRVLIGALETVKGFEITAGSSLDDLIEIMRARSEQLDKVAQDLNDLVNAAQSSTGLYVLNVPLGTGGVNRLKAEIRDPFLECQKNHYSAMVIFVGGGPSAKPVDTLRGLFLQ